MSTIEISTGAAVEGRQAPLAAAPAGRAARPAADERWLDLGERGFVLLLYGWLVARILRTYLTDGGLANLLLLPSEGLVVIFLLLRRRTSAISRSPYEWALAIAATCAPLMVVPGMGRALVPPVVAASLLMFGMVLQLHAKLVLGRSFGCVPAHRGLKLAGPYKFVRHPMYAGYLLSHLAFLAMNPTWWNALVYGLCYGSQVVRIRAEEQLLGRDPAYRAYCEQVRHRLIPWLF